MTNQNITHTVPSDERIIAQNGDMIAVGALFGRHNPRLAATTNDGIEYKSSSWLDPTTLNPGMTLTTTYNGEATFSLSVAISTE